MDRGIIFNVQRYSIRDGPGIRTTVFFKGCPLSCWWCHNPEGQKEKPELMIRADRCIGCGECLKACPRGAVARADGAFLTDQKKCTACGKCADACPAEARLLAGREVTAEELLAEIEKDTVFFDESGGGVTFSGGEPLRQARFLKEALIACRKKEIRTAVDTSGFADTRTVLEIGNYADLFLYDLKIMDEQKHKKYTGVSNQLILNNLIALSRSHGNIFVRLPVIPGINDDRENILETGRFLSALAGVRRVKVLAYHETGLGKYERLGRSYGLRGVKPPPAEKIKEIEEMLKKCGLNIED